MRLRFYIDRESGEPQVRGHGVTEREVREVLGRPLEDRPGREGSRVALGQASAGRYVRVVYGPDAEPRSAFVVTAYEIGPKAKRALQRTEKEAMNKQRQFPRGWDDDRVRRVLEHYEGQGDAEAVAEDEAAFGRPSHTAMKVPIALVPEVRRLLAKHLPANKRLQPTRRRAARG
jgi:hypothetical protein